MRALTLSALSLLLATAGCATAPTDRQPVRTAASPVEARTPVTILISIDGFRPDYIDRGITPALSRLAVDGTRAAMRPSFPSKTFPNHWALLTGDRPDRNGIVSNSMEDPAGRKKKFTMTTEDPWWWNTTPPLWVDAEKAGIRSASMFWPGSSVGFGGKRADAWPNDVTGGTRPSDWVPYGEAVTGLQRVDGVIDWMRRPAATRPRFVTLYFDIVDTQGHNFGPNSAELNAAVAEVDRDIAHLVDELAALGQPANLVVVADHGMAEAPLDKVIPLASLVAPEIGRKVEDGVFATLQPMPGKEAALAASLSRPHPHIQCWPKAQIPARFHYGTNPRIPPWLCLAEPGWRILAEPPERQRTGGEHGYDNDAPDMRALFIASGPAFAQGRTLPVFDNVDVYPLLRQVIGLPPVTTVDGTIAPVRGALR
ncbi:MAG: ectonucleotide pyrophosphatase/phosphodiesterase [Pseudomonadota bacterium]